MRTFKNIIDTRVIFSRKILVPNYELSRSASSEADDPLTKHKLIRKGLTPASKSNYQGASKSLTDTLPDDRGIIKRALNFPETTPALRDDLPDIFKIKEMRRDIARLTPFYHNLIIYDFPKLPPVKHAELKNVQQEYHGMTAEDLGDETVWLPIFRMPAIPTIRAIVRFKLYLTGISSLFLARELSHICTHGLEIDLLPMTTLAGLTFGGLLFIGNNFRQLVVQVYTSEDLRYLRFSRLTFFGKRRDIIVPISCVTPLTETNPTMRMPFYKLKFTRPKDVDLKQDYLEFYDETLRICVLLGGMRDRELFEATLGKLLRHKVAA